MTRTCMLAGWLLAALAATAATEKPAWKADVEAARQAMNAGLLEKAETHLQLARRAASLTGNPDGDLASAYERLAEQYKRSGGLERAIARLQDAIEIWSAVIGENQPKVAAVIARMARLCEESGRYEEAERYYRKSVAVLKSHYSESDPAMAAALGRLAEYLAARGRLDEAERTYRQAVGVLDQAFGSPSPALATTLDAAIGPLLRASRYRLALDLETAARRTGRLASRIGKGVHPPMLVSKTEPSFTEQARQLRVQGAVRLAMVVDETGVPAAIWVTEPLGFGLDEEAVKAVSQWRFQPGVSNGEPTPVITQVEVHLRLL